MCVHRGIPSCYSVQQCHIMTWTTTVITNTHSRETPRLGVVSKYHTCSIPVRWIYGSAVK